MRAKQYFEDVIVGTFISLQALFNTIQLFLLVASIGGPVPILEANRRYGPYGPDALLLIL